MKDKQVWITWMKNTVIENEGEIFTPIKTSYKAEGIWICISRIKNLKGRLRSSDFIL
jgi:hypothetical protein